MVHDVVNVRCPDTKPALCALAAEGFAQNLRRSKIAFPFVGLVHPSPGLCLGAAPVAARPVCVAVTVAHQHAAAWVSARSQWLMAHGLSPPGKNKKPAPTQTAFADHADQDGLFPANLAVHGQRPRPGLGVEPEDFPSAASRAKEPSVLCVQFISLCTVLQCLFLTFLRLSVNIHQVSRIRNQYLK